VLTEDMGLVPGNRVLLHGPNTPQLAACWFAALKAGAVPVPTMPLLRAKELAVAIDKARISHALSDGRLAAEMQAARASSPTLREVCYFHSDDANGLERRAQRKPEHFDNVDTAAEDVALIAFTSGTSGVPKGTMHLHRDVMATCGGCLSAPLFATTTSIESEALFPAASNATARTRCGPSGSAVVSHEAVYGCVVSLPICRASTSNLTRVTPTLSVASARTVTVRFTVELAAGAVSFTLGACLSELPPPPSAVCSMAPDPPTA